jgi:hypothetical protein
MQPISQTEINSKISRTMLGRRRQSMQTAILEKLTPEQRGRIAPRVMQFHHAVDAQNWRDSEVLASLGRSLRSPRGADAERFIELLRGAVMESERTD